MSRLASAGPDSTGAAPQPRRPARTRGAAVMVAAGVFGSRLTGLIRQSAIAHYFGSSDAADAFSAAFRIPNLLQNLFGEGSLSAAFIPVYAAHLARNEDDEARRTAGAVLAMLTLVTAMVVLLGVVATPYVMGVIAPGFHGAKRELTIRLVQIMFPGTGLLVFSAWCLGVLNSHRRFLLSYIAPVAWNGAMIVTLLGFGRRFHGDALALLLAGGFVVGSGLQLAVQWPAARRLAGGIAWSLRHRSHHVREVLRNFVPVFLSRGVVQISSYIDGLLATLLPAGAVATLAYARPLQILPVSLFGMAVSAAELPAMASALGPADEIAAALRRRLNAGLRQIAFFVLPSIVAFLLLGDVIVAAIYRSGAFHQSDVIWVWGTLAGACVGMLASALGRLYSSAYYALRDTRNPLHYATVRIILTTALGIYAAFWLPGQVGLSPRWGVAGLTASAGVAAWVEFTLLRRGLRGRVGETGVPRSFLVRVGAAALLAALAARGVFAALGSHRPRLSAIAVLGVYGLLFLALAWWQKLPELDAVRRLARRSSGGR